MRSTRTLVRTFVIMIVLLAVVFTGCRKPDAGGDVTIACTNDQPPVSLQLDCPALPNTIASGAMQTTPDGSKVLDYDLFAWNSFVALNWPALIPTAENGFQRGFPDLTKSFVAVAPDDLLVWETLKEKREIFLADPFTGHITPNPQPTPWNAEPVYGPPNQQVPMCEGMAALDVAMERHIVLPVKVDTYDTEDETAEVASEARETDAVLCVGHEPDCGVSGSTVGPRVWRGQPNQGGVPILYEVKVNWDFYNYVQTFSPGPLWVQSNARTAALGGDIRLPARTSAQQAPWVPAGSHVQDPPPPGQPTHGFNPLVTSYSTEGCLDGPRQTPCPAGSIHLKAAWLPLSEKAAASGKYHVARAFYYKHTGADKCKVQQIFGLVGLHIIQRIHEQHFTDQNGTMVADEPATPHGGNFIFASWEHVDNDQAGFTYVNLGPTTLDGQPVTDPQPFPNIDDKTVAAIPLKRVYDLLPTTKTANEIVHQALGCSDHQTPKSVWCHYKLIGTQYVAANLPSPAPDLLTTIPAQPLPNVENPAGSGQPYYLANLVIESNLGLQQFQGVPPGFAPVAHFTTPKPPPGTSGRIRGQGGPAPEIVANTDFFHFNHTFNNLAWRIGPRIKDVVDQSKIQNNQGQFEGKKRGAFNMGGCMGCHGVAQTEGYSFSFVLLDNQAGGSPDTQEEVVIPPVPFDAD